MKSLSIETTAVSRKLLMTQKDDGGGHLHKILLTFKFDIVYNWQSIRKMIVRTE